MTNIVQSIKGSTAGTLTLAAVGALFGCSVEAARSPLAANSKVIDRETSAALSTGVLQWADGVYGSSCLTHAPGSGWSLQIATGTGSMDSAPLTVVQDDSACQLTLTAVVTNENTSTTYTATPGIALGGSYLVTASSFSSGSGIAFYGNAMLSPTDYSTPITVSILYSDNPNLAAGVLQGAYATVTSASETQSIPSPNDTLDVSGLTVTVDANFQVESVLGSGTLTMGSVTGNSYYVDHGALAAVGGSPSFDQLDNAYRNAVSTTPIVGSENVTIGASAFDLSSANLTSAVGRTIVIQSLVANVASYQTFYIAFTHP